jgi:hypothetical protein
VGPRSDDYVDGRNDGLTGLGDDQLIDEALIRLRGEL